MATKNNKYGAKSYLKDTGFKTFYLDVATLPSIPLTNGDQVQVPPECENRIDLFSYQQYGSSRLWWIIALANADNIRDPTWDFKAGMVVFVPRDEALLSSISGAN
jgi:hypothetical protein